MVYVEGKKISKEIYEEAMANRGYIPEDRKIEVFGEALVYGYGVYGAKVRIDENGNYVVDFSRGNTCD